jgi:DNA-binding NarL/FixJ family response regulator
MDHLRILVVDDHKAVRLGLRLYLTEACPQARIEEAQSGRQALEMVAAAPPDVVLMDVAMSDLDGEESTRRIKAQWPEVKVVALVMNWRQAEMALNAGADAWLLKGMSSVEVLDTFGALGLQAGVQSPTPATGNEPDSV